MKLVITTLTCLLVFGCNTAKSTKSPNSSISAKAELYSNNYEYGLLKSSSLMIKQGPNIKEQFIINGTHEWISHFTFNISPYDQFRTILEVDPQTPYEIAKQKLSFDLLNYSGKDCNTIKGAIEKYSENLDLSSKQKTLPVKIDSPTYIYQYKSGVEGVEKKRISVTIEEHPIVDFYHDLKTAIQRCPHPKVPKYHKVK